MFVDGGTMRRVLGVLLPDNRLQIPMCAEGELSTFDRCGVKGFAA
jgi:hypothetical protein